MPDSVENLLRPSDARSPGAFWWAQFVEEKKVFDDWREEGCKIIEFYRGDDSKVAAPEFNLLWANVSSLQPTILSRIPQPDVSRRFLGDGPIYRKAADIIQKSLQAQNDISSFNFGRELRRVRDDRLLPGRGVGRIVYEEVREEFEDGRPPDIAMQYVRLQHVFWQDFTHGPARCWDEVPWIRYRHLLTRDQVERQFGEAAANKIAYADFGQRNRDDDDPPGALKKAEIFEVWAKSEYIEPSDPDMEIGPDTGEIIWLANPKRSTDGEVRTNPSTMMVLKREKPTVNFRGFFDCPEPLFATMTTDTMVPVPDASVYRNLLEELNDVTKRIRALVSMARVKGLADGSLSDLPGLMQADDGEIIPTDSGAYLRDTGGLERNIWMWPLEMVVGAIEALSVRQEQLKQMIYEVTGVSDIIRGATNPNETASAQRLKSNFAQLRMTPRQLPMEEFVRRVFEMQAEVIAELFTPQVLATMVDLDENDPETQQAIELLRSDTLRRLRVDVETDTLVAPDEQQLKADAVEYLNTVAPIIAGFGELPPALKPLGGEILKHASRPFKIGKAIEEQIDELVEQASNPQPGQQQPPQSEAEVEAQAKLQEAQIEAQTDIQEAQIKAQVDLQIAQLKAEMEERIKMREAQIDAQLEQMKIRMQADVAREQGERNAEVAERGQDVQAKTAEKTASASTAKK